MSKLPLRVVPTAFNFPASMRALATSGAKPTSAGAGVTSARSTATTSRAGGSGPLAVKKKRPRSPAIGAGLGAANSIVS